jgi:hypothetical protein
VGARNSPPSRLYCVREAVTSIATVVDDADAGNTATSADVTTTYNRCDV